MPPRWEIKYRYQTIGAYPSGGGSYTVARSNLGVQAGLLAAAALLLDYILMVAIGISAGIGALVSALPVLQPYTLGLCLSLLALIAIVNLRYISQLHDRFPNRQIAAVIPELVERHWYHYFLHNQRAAVLRGMLLVRGEQGTVVINVPWYLST